MNGGMIGGGIGGLRSVGGITGGRNQITGVRVGGGDEGVLPEGGKITNCASRSVISGVVGVVIRPCFGRGINIVSILKGGFVSVTGLVIYGT